MEFEKVLIPTDWSDYADESVQRAIEIPGIREVVLLHVATLREPSGNNANSHVPGHSHQTIIDRLHKDKALLEGHGIATTILTEPSHHTEIARTILDVAGTTGVSLIAIGARGTSRIREALLGSVSHDVIRNARTHVLLMHPSGRKSGEHLQDPSAKPLCAKVLCPVDLSKTSDETVRSLLRCLNRSDVILLHVIRTAESTRHLDVLHQRATIRLNEFQQELGLQGIRAEIMIRIGDPALVTCTVAEREGVTLILLSRYGRFDYMKTILIGSVAESIVLRSTRPVLLRYPRIRLDVLVRELSENEFTIAEKIWLFYHSQKAEKTTDRIFAVFVEETPAGVARSRRHPDGNEVDGVFVLHEFRDHGYARRLMQVLIEQCGSEVLYMHATLELVTFYRSFGFVPIPEDDLPSTIRERFNFALGNMQGSDVCPMKRVPLKKTTG
jgi:nucleotide-binding universal stress UspA family protein/N-acetylglutamate synthase-like GNAT family acetyltransferase